MGDIKLFTLNSGTVIELIGSPMKLEKPLQTLMESNLEAMLGVRFVSTEHSTGKSHSGRIDTLGLDETGCPVIIEYKRQLNENVISQGLYYLDWLMDHRGDFELLVTKSLGQKVAEQIDWSSPRLICIAADFTKYDQHAVQQINRNIELIRYRKFGEGLLLLDLITATSATSYTDASNAPANGGGKSTGQVYKTHAQKLAEISGEYRDLVDETREWINALGDDVTEKLLKYYFAYQRLKNFASVELYTGNECIKIFVKVDPSSISLEDEFTRDVREIGHLGVGDLEITVRSPDDLEKAKPLIRQSYEAN